MWLLPSKTEKKKYDITYNAILTNINLAALPISNLNCAKGDGMSRKEV